MTSNDKNKKVQVVGEVKGLRLYKLVDDALGKIQTPEEETPLETTPAPRRRVNKMDLGNEGNKK